MIGTEKQIEYANSIKTKMIEIYNEYLSQGSVSEEEKNYFNLIIDIQDSRFWIETKSGLGLEMNLEYSYKKGIKKGLVNDHI